METRIPLSLTAKQRLAVTIGVMTGMFLAALEATVVGTAMPTVIASLGGLHHYSWVFSAYLLASTVTVPLWGKLSDLYGRRPLYQMGVAIFLLGSILSGVSTSMFQLIVFRAIQGLGAGAIVPIAMTIVGEIYTVRERARKQAYFSGVWGFASILGPIVGGFLTDQLSWRWVFFINIPFGLLSVLIIGKYLKEPKSAGHPIVDYAGAFTLTSGIVLLMLALVESGTLSALLSFRNIALLCASMVLLAIFVRIEKSVREPILPFALFRNRVVTISVSGGFLIGIAMFGAISFIPLYAQGTRGLSATQAGSLLTPLMLSWVILSVVGGRLLLKIGYRPTVIAGCILLIASFAWLSTLDTESPMWWLYADLVLIGAGLGLTMLTLLIAVQQSVPRQILGTATSLNLFSRSIGGAIGVAIMGAFLSAGLASNLQEAARKPMAILSLDDASRLAANPNALIEPLARAALPAPTLHLLQISLSDALKDVFVVALIVSVLALLVVLRLPEHKAFPADPKQESPPPDAIQEDRLAMAEAVTDCEPGAR